MKKLFSTFILIASFGFGFSQTQLRVNNFLIDTTNIPEYKKAFLVTENDTLITWEKENNSTVTRYLDVKVTTTQWKDSNEVCIQEGLMLDNFEEHCIRKNTDGKLLFESRKNVDYYSYTRIKENATYHFTKSYTNGRKSERWTYPNGDNYFKGVNSQNENYINRKIGDTSIQFSCAGVDTTFYSFKMPDSTYSYSAKTKTTTYSVDIDDYRVTLIKSPDKTDSIFIRRESTPKYFSKCNHENKFLLSHKTWIYDTILGQNLNATFSKLPCNKSSSYTYKVEYERPLANVNDTSWLAYPHTKIIYLDIDSVILKSVEFVFKNNIPIKKYVTENGKKKKLKISNAELKTLEEDYVICGFGKEMNTKPNTILKVRPSLPILLNDGINTYSAEIWLNLYYKKYCRNINKPIDEKQLLVFDGPFLDRLLKGKNAQFTYDYWMEVTKIVANSYSTSIYFLNKNGKSTVKKSQFVFKIDFYSIQP